MRKELKKLPMRLLPVTIALRIAHANAPQGTLRASVRPGTLRASVRAATTVATVVMAEETADRFG